MQHAPRPCFGIATAPQQVDYHDILRVWREADTIPAIEHAWVFDHLRPIFGDPDGPIFEGWALLSALAAHTRRPRLGVMVTSNRFRPPAMLAKIACPSTTPSELLDRYCAQIGRDPASITRSIHLPVSYDQPGVTQDAIGEATGAGFRHIVRGLPAPWPPDVARWVADKLISTPARESSVTNRLTQGDGFTTSALPPPRRTGSAMDSRRPPPSTRSAVASPG